PRAQSAAEARLAAVAYATDKAAGNKMLDALLARDPKHVESLILKARWLIVDNKPTEALARAQDAVKADPESALAHYLVGTIQAGLRQNREAIASLNEVLRLNPRASAAQLVLSRLHLVGGDTQSALTMAEGAVANVPGSPDARAALARSLI